MSAKTNNIRIGLFLLFGIFLFIAGLLAFGARSYFVPKFTYETAVEGDVAGLSVGSKVMLRGVPVGNVSSIDFAVNLYPGSTSRVIIVEYQIYRPVFMKDQTAEGRERRRQEEVTRGLRTMVKGEGITGSSILELRRLDPLRYPPPPIDYTPRHPYVPSAPGQFTRMLESIEQSLEDIQKLDMEGINLGVSNALARASQLLDKLNRLDLENTVSKAGDLIDTLKATVADIGTNVNSMKLDALSRHTDDLVVGLKESNAKLQNALERTDTVLKEVGSVPMKATVDDLRSAIQTLDSVLMELKRYPAGFIFGEPPPPARSVKPPGK